jgi:hypothetical protein
MTLKQYKNIFDQTKHVFFKSVTKITNQEAQATQTTLSLIQHITNLIFSPANMIK